MIRLRPSELTLTPDDVEQTFRRIAQRQASTPSIIASTRASAHPGQALLRRGPQRSTRDAITILGDIPILRPRSQRAVHVSSDDDVVDSPAPSASRRDSVTGPSPVLHAHSLSAPPALNTMNLPLRLSRHRQSSDTHVELRGGGKEHAKDLSQDAPGSHSRSPSPPLPEAELVPQPELSHEGSEHVRLEIPDVGGRLPTKYLSGRFSGTGYSFEEFDLQYEVAEPQQSGRPLSLRRSRSGGELFALGTRTPIPGQARSEGARDGGLFGQAPATDPQIRPRRGARSGSVAFSRHSSDLPPSSSDGSGGRGSSHPNLTSPLPSNPYARGQAGHGFVQLPPRVGPPPSYQSLYQTAHPGPHQSPYPGPYQSPYPDPYQNPYLNPYHNPYSGPYQNLDYPQAYPSGYQSYQQSSTQETHMPSQSSTLESQQRAQQMQQRQQGRHSFRRTHRQEQQHRQLVHQQQMQQQQLPHFQMQPLPQQHPHQHQHQHRNSHHQQHSTQHSSDHSRGASGPAARPLSHSETQRPRANQRSSENIPVDSASFQARPPQHLHNAAQPSQPPIGMFSSLPPRQPGAPREDPQNEPSMRGGAPAPSRQASRQHSALPLYMQPLFYHEPVTTEPSLRQLRPARSPLAALAFDHGTGTGTRLPRSPLVRPGAAVHTQRRVPARQRNQENSGDAEMAAMRREEAAILARYSEEAQGEVMDETPPPVGRVERRMFE